MKTLVVQRPLQEEELIALNQANLDKYDIDDFELEKMESGRIIWHGEIAFEISED
jgi:hypothetical protein